MLSVETGVLPALESDHVHFAWLIDIEGDIEHWRWTTHGHDLVVEGVTYVSEGQVAGLPAIVRERDIKLQSYTIRLVGSDRVEAALFRMRYLVGRPVTVSLVLLEGESGVIGGKAIRLYKGSVHSWREIEDDTSARVELKITSPWSSLPC
ncbi:hypothetical protein [Kordiimonas aestuarii]|uniref:hypothetical protein n=1 Tax=Kordiimonas aestuarii TaxID=1005925 RepID=UPI0021D00C0F|nr:hypothetical protein [Kordiimonas aestuarii]